MTRVKDPFGPAVGERPWNDDQSPIDRPITRRTFLKGSVGSAVLLALPGAFLADRADAASAVSGAAPFFIFGVPTPELMSGPGLEGGDLAQTAGTVAVSSVATQLATLPVVSSDHGKLAAVGLTETIGGVELAVSIVDMTSGSIVVTGQTSVSAGSDSMILVTPVFAADSATVAIVLSVSIPSDWKAITKFNPITGGTSSIQGATWTSHHELIYFNYRTSTFAGPFDLADAPSLARVEVAADDQSLYLWTMAEPIAVRGTKENPLPAPIPQLSSFPLGSGTPRLIVPASPVWPGDGGATFAYQKGALGRLVSNGQVEIYSTTTGAYATTTVSPLAEEHAKPTPTTLQVLPDGTAMLVNATLGKAAHVAPSANFSVLNTIGFSPPRFARSTPSRKADVSPDGSTLYVIGGLAEGGLAAYDVSSGALIASQANGVPYSGVRALANGCVLALSPATPQLAFFNSELGSLGTAAADLSIAEVYA